MPKREIARLRTTVLTIDPTAIDWGCVAQQGQFRFYEIPWAERRRWDHLHNWYLAASDHPYYLNTAARRLYVLVPHGMECPELNYEGHSWRSAPLDIQQPQNYHAVVKLLLSAFLYRRQIYAANGDFYLLVRVTPQNFAKVLKLRLAQQWRDGAPYDLAVIDEATTLRPIQDTPGSTTAWPWATYGHDTRGGLPVLRRVHPGAAPRKVPGLLYTRLKKSQYRTTIPYLVLGSETALRTSRLAVLDLFLEELVAFFGGVGLPFSLKELAAERVDRRSGPAFKEPQIHFDGQRIAVFDDRIRPHIMPEREPAGFVEQLFNRLREIAEEHLGATMALIGKEDLASADLVLRLQDNDRGDFLRLDPEDQETSEHVLEQPPLLATHRDPYQVYATHYGSITTQSININRTRKPGANTADGDAMDEEDEGTASSDVNGPISLEQYMSYALPTRKTLETIVTNSLYQLFLKQLVRSPEDALRRLPALYAMGETIFCHAEGMVYREGGALRFLSLINSDEAAQVIRARTPWDLDEDIIGPSYDRRYGTDDEEADDEREGRILRDSYFMINRDEVWQIEASDGRVLHDTQAIRARLQAQEVPFPTEQIRPHYTAEELAIFSHEILDALDTYLVHETGSTTSYRALMGARERLYPLLGFDIRDRGQIRSGTLKLQNYLATKGIAIRSPKGSDVIPGYVGISYVRATQQYYVGDKNSINDGQERGFVLRRLVRHRPGPVLPSDTHDHDRIFAYLQSAFFSLLEVNFIRYHQYTVVPFPFRLIVMWQEEQARLRLGTIA